MSGNFGSRRIHGLLADKMQVDRYPDLQRLHTSTMGRARLDSLSTISPSPTGPRHRSPNQLTARKLRMQEPGLDRGQAVTQTKVSRKAGRPRKTRQRKRHIDSELDAMALPPRPTRPDSQQHSESGYSGISQSMDISQPSQTCLPPSQNAPENNTQSDDNVEGIFGPDHPRIPVTKLLNQ